MKRDKLQKRTRIVPAGTIQETGLSRFIKKANSNEHDRVIKDAKANNEDALPDFNSKAESYDLPDKPKFLPLPDSEDKLQQDQNQADTDSRL